MNRQELLRQINLKHSFLCVGLDSDASKIPRFFLDYDNPVLAFNKRIIEVTRPYCVAYKPNFAFYESQGSQGWDTLKETIEYIGDDHLTIADAKRGDIGNTADQYAKAIFKDLGFDAVTVAPYMGSDSIFPFLEYKDKWTIALGLTSNPGHQDFQLLELNEGGHLYEHIIRRLIEWGSSEQLMLVVGATRIPFLERIRDIAPDHFWLVPGVGAQGGSLNDVWQHGRSKDIGLLVNSSRGIIYASNDLDFDVAAAEAARTVQMKMQGLMKDNM